MTVTNWYQSGEHENFAPKTQAGPVEDPTDVLSVYRTHEHKRRERAVKIAHFRLIEDKLRKCILYHGNHSFRQNCKHLIHEFQQTKNELFDWKEETPIEKNLWNADKHYDPPAG